jgi:hypothetical protein
MGRYSEILTERLKMAAEAALVTQRTPTTDDVRRIMAGVIEVADQDYSERNRAMDSRCFLFQRPTQDNGYEGPIRLIPITLESVQQAFDCDDPYEREALKGTYFYLNDAGGLDEITTANYEHSHRSDYEEELSMCATVMGSSDLVASGKVIGSVTYLER